MCVLQKYGIMSESSTAAAAGRRGAAAGQMQNAYAGGKRRGVVCGNVLLYIVYA